MSSPPLPQPRLIAVASVTRRLQVRLRNMGLPGLRIAGIVSAALLGWWLTGQAWVAMVIVAAGMVLGACSMVRTGRAVRDALQQAQRDLESLEQALRGAQDALRQSQKAATLGRLTLGVAHDFNNHLTAISSNVEMVARRPDQPQQRLLRHTEAAMQGVRRAAALTARLLSFSRDSDPEPEVVEVDRLLRGLADLLRRSLADRVDLEVPLLDQPWLIWADLNQMESGLLSVAVNVCDWGREHGTLAIALSHARIDAAVGNTDPALLPGDYVQIAIGDGAAGATADAWLPVDELSRPDLVMACSFVRGAGGVIQQSAPSGGASSLRLFLPRYRPAPRARGAVRRDKTGPATILVVEDDPEVRGACVELLSELGYQVLAAPDAMEAFRLITDHGGIDLLFTDLGLPGGVSGWALADAVRNLDPSMRVLFTTGYEQADRPHPTDARLLRKPFNSAELASFVQGALAGEPPIERSEAMRG